MFYNDIYGSPNSWVAKPKSTNHFFVLCENHIKFNLTSSSAISFEKPPLAKVRKGED
jgi:hypothetical protein